ncbi:MAG: Uma2 family endonuclease [Chloroflexi bacterium]|nr:Uma2 family endonuclease [Chloroflexota bacterium]MCY4248436.1 Uma2 family endonuclease [Chloroflexota bacterium]
MVVRERFLTADRFLEMMEQPEYLDRAFELVAGEPIEVPKLSRIRGIVVANLTAEIVYFVKRNGLGEVNAGDTGFILKSDAYGRDTVRGLDIAFVRKGRAPEPPDFKLYELGPDLAVEVISPNNKTSDSHLKVMQLFEAGARLVWLVYPESRTVVTHTDERAITLHENDTLFGGDVLPGFALRVGDIFPS